MSDTKVELAHKLTASSSSSKFPSSVAPQDGRGAHGSRARLAKNRVAWNVERHAATEPLPSYALCGKTKYRSEDSTKCHHLNQQVGILGVVFPFFSMVALQPVWICLWHPCIWDPINVLQEFELLFICSTASIWSKPVPSFSMTPVFTLSCSSWTFTFGCYSSLASRYLRFDSEQAAPLCFASVDSCSILPTGTTAASLNKSNFTSPQFEKRCDWKSACSRLNRDTIRRAAGWAPPQI